MVATVLGRVAAARIAAAAAAGQEQDRPLPARLPGAEAAGEVSGQAAGMTDQAAALSGAKAGRGASCEPFDGLVKSLSAAVQQSRSRRGERGFDRLSRRSAGTWLRQACPEPVEGLSRRAQ